MTDPSEATDTKDLEGEGNCDATRRYDEPHAISPNRARSAKRHVQRSRAAPKKPRR